MRHISLIIRDYDHFKKNQKEFDLAKSYATINNERIQFDKIKQVQNNSDGDGLFFNNVNIFPGAVLHCHVNLDHSLLEKES